MVIIESNVFVVSFMVEVVDLKDILNGVGGVF